MSRQKKGKPRPYWPLLVCSVLAGCGGPGVQKANAPAASGDSVVAQVSDSLKAEILGLSDRLTGAYKRGEWPAVAALLADDYLGSGVGLEWNRATLQSEFLRIQLVDCIRESSTVKALAPGVILLNEDAVLRETYAGQDISGRYRFTTIWERRGSQWRLVFEQEIPLPGQPH